MGDDRTAAGNDTTTVELVVHDAARSDGPLTVRAWPLSDGFAIDPSDCATMTGWHLTPAGLCRDDRCVPLPTGALPADPSAPVPLATLTAALGVPTATDVDAGLAVLGVPPPVRGDRLAQRRAPSLALPTTSGATLHFDDLHGNRTLLVAWASWCGCRYDLPQWQAVADELAPYGLQVVGVAVDEDVADVRPWVDDAGVRFPVVVDRDHEVVEAFAMTHVPTVVWLDEECRVVRPNTVAFADDTFTSVHGVRAAPHLEALRRWVRDGDTGIDTGEVLRRSSAPTFDAQLARAEFRLAVLLHRAGDEVGAARHFDAAEALAPDDFTIRRAAMPLRGRNPFGPEFFEWYAQWRERGEPGYDHME